MFVALNVLLLLLLLLCLLMLMDGGAREGDAEGDGMACFFFRQAHVALEARYCTLVAHSRQDVSTRFQKGLK